jgi:general secretion pathway protein H
MKKKIGFTLIELLIVMVIISIVAGIAVITISSNQRKQYETLANQLVNSILLAEQEAMLRPTTLGLAFTKHSFQFYTIQPDPETHENKWVAIDKPPLGRHSLPNNIQITLKIQNEIVETNDSPKIIITPSNDLTPFIILIGKEDETPYYQVKGQANGEVTSATVSEE